MNGTRLGTYQICINAGITSKPDGSKSFWRSVLAGALAGCIGASLASPLYLVKTHLQAEASREIAVGHQHHHSSMLQAFRSIYGLHGVVGLWRGVSGAVPRVMAGSSSQLATFSLSKEWLEKHFHFGPHDWKCTFLATCISSLSVTVFMTPFDVVSLRLYNQPVDASGRGTFYSGFLDCVAKVLRKEGPLGFYKGWTAVFLRLAPHTIFSLLFWDELRKFYFATFPTAPG
ncbi:solute carrier family 25 member 34-like isoform X2 [Paramacrobiotus metropolitanus]|nr:solute carrier family 25 member 34-like isoform X2 [Paramacrobiotus metropolitanus]